MIYLIYYNRISFWIKELGQNISNNGNQITYVRIISKFSLFKFLLDIEANLFFFKGKFNANHETSIDEIEFDTFIEKLSNNNQNKTLIIFEPFSLKSQVESIKSFLSDNDRFYYLRFDYNYNKSISFFKIFNGKKFNFKSTIIKYENEVEYEYPIISTIDSYSFAKVMIPYYFKLVGIFSNDRYFFNLNFKRKSSIDYDIDFNLFGYLNYLFYFIYGFFKNKIYNYIGLDAWRIGIFADDINSCFSGENSFSTPVVLRHNSPNRFFWADPFLLQNEGRKYIFFEELEYSENKGYISVVEIDDTLRIVYYKTKIIETSFHMSYPFLFHWKGVQYLIPETYEEGGLHFYECLKMPHTWVRSFTLFKDEKLIDSTIYFHEGKLWLFCIKPFHSKAPFTDDLFIYYADDLFGEWHSHSQNPIKSDCTNSRPAGNIFQIGDQIYRPTQNCSATYGTKITLNKIILLNEKEFKEDVIDYDFLKIPGMRNHHVTISENVNLTVFDFMKA